MLYYLGRVIHPGIELKRQGFGERIKKEHTLEKLDIKAPVFFENAHLEVALVLILGENYYYIYCL